MSKYFVLTDGLTPAQKNNLTQAIRDNSWAFWHWLEDVWLVTSESLDDSPKEVQGKLIDAIPALSSARLIVFKVDGRITHGGRLPRKAWPWLKKNWSKGE